MGERLSLPGFVDAHSHAFQRALRGRTEGGDFWAWRETMLEEAERQTPGSVRATYAATYRELRAAGYTAVGEFHYIGLAEAHAALDAAREAGIELVLLLSAYARGGLPRFRQESAADYLRQMLADHLVHAWDLAAAIGADRTLHPEAVAECARWFAGVEDAYRSGGAIGPRVGVPPDASEQDRLIAGFGRDPAWPAGS